MDTGQCEHLIERRDCQDCRARGQQRATLEDFFRQVPAARSTEAGRMIRDYGPWFVADYDGSCAGCGFDIEPGDEIRADGEGGWLCRDCGEPE